MINIINMNAESETEYVDIYGLIAKLEIVCIFYVQYDTSGGNGRIFRYGLPNIYHKWVSFKDLTTTGISYESNKIMICACDRFVTNNEISEIEKLIRNNWSFITAFDYDTFNRQLKDLIINPTKEVSIKSDKT